MLSTDSSKIAKTADLFRFSAAYEFSTADYKIWNTNGEALFAHPPSVIIS